jgi:hypothetical protein
MLLGGGSRAQAQWTTDSSNNIYYNSGTVAVGSTPSGNYKFEVFGQGNVGTGAKIGVLALARSGGDYDSIGYNFRPTSTNGLYHYDLADTSSRLEFTTGGFKFKTAPSGTGGNTITYSDAMTILQGGNVGIGTVSPGYKLNIEKTDSGTGVALNPILTLTNQQYTVNTGASLGFEFAAGILGSAITGLSAQANGGGSLAFSTRTNSGEIGERLRIDGNGSIGIGVIPSGNYKFEVAGLGAAGTGAKIGTAMIARSGGDYDSVGYNFRPTSTTGQYYYDGLDSSSRLEFTSGGFSFKTAGAGSAGNTIQYTDAMTVLQTGNVGIGTTSPGYLLDVRGPVRTTSQFTSDLNGGGFYQSVAAAGMWGQSDYLRLTNWSDTNKGINIQVSTGNVAIGKASATAKLDVEGDIKVNGNIAAKYQDVAEWVESSERLAAGTVVVLDANKSNRVIASSESYDTRVAGVISEQPGITLGEKSDGKVLVATTGRVRVKVDASKGPIHIGDLLVTSDVQGVAMKSEPVKFAGRKMHMPGTIIGKALEPWAKGKGEILVLLSLQ